MLKKTLIVLGAIAGFIALYALLFGLSFLGIHTGGILRTEQAKVNREVFEQTPSFTRGMASEFSTLLLEWETTKSPAVCAVIKQRFGTYYDVLPGHQQARYDQLSCVQ